MRQKFRRQWRRLRLRLIPAKQLVTLEIDNSGIRLLEIRGQEVVKWAVRPLSPGLFENEVVTNPRALGIAIRQLLKSNGIKVRNINASLSGLYSLSRIVSLPASPSREAVTQEAVLEKVKEVLPFSEEEIYLSWQPIVNTGEENRVLVIGTPRNLVDGQVKAVRAAGSRIRVLELKAMALVRAVDRKQALILNIEPSTFDSILIADGVVQSMHTASWQPDGMSENDMAEQLTVVLELTIGASNSSRPGILFDPATPLYITGSMSDDQQLAAAIMSRVVYPAGKIVPWLECPPHFPVSQYAVNIGLASRRPNAAKKPAVSEMVPLTMNLLPQIYRPWKPTSRQIYVFLSVTAIIALLFPTYNLISNVNAKTINLKTTYDRGKAQMERRQSELAKREPLQKFLGTYQSIVDMDGDFMEDLSVITDNAAKFGVEVTGINYGGGSIVVSAAADNSTAFRDYILALRVAGRFSTVTGPSELFPPPTEGQIRLVPQPVSGNATK